MDWQLDGIPGGPGEKAAQRVSQCKQPLEVPETGVPATFTGELSRDGRYMLCCYFAFPTGPDKCPNCGLPIESQARVVETAAGELQELTEADRAALEAEIRSTSGRKAEYLDLVATGKAKKYKPGYASFMFHQKYGFWPPKGWKAEVERIVKG